MVSASTLFMSATRTNPFPILLTHGYPDSFLRFAKIIHAGRSSHFAGDPADSFHVIAPSLPGYGFSDKPAKPGMIFHVGDLWSKLMGQLGYTRFAAHGGDWGSTVTEQLARSHSDSVVGIHLTDVPFAHIFQKPDDLSSHEKKYLAETKQWQKKSGAYAMIQGTRPQSLAHGLNDSPAGLAGWLIEKFREWSDCGGNVEKRFTKDELLTNAVIYWATETIYSSFLPLSRYANFGTHMDRWSRSGSDHPKVRRPLPCSRRI